MKGPATEQLTGRGLSANLVRVIGSAEVAGAVGLIIGLAWDRLDIAAAVGMVIVFVPRPHHTRGSVTTRTPRPWSATYQR